MNLLLIVMFDRVNQLKFRVYVFTMHLLHLADCCVYSIYLHFYSLNSLKFILNNIKKLNKQ